MVKNEGSEDFGGVLASWMVELEAAKEMLAYIYDIQVSKVENWIQQHTISEFPSGWNQPNMHQPESCLFRKKYISVSRNLYMVTSQFWKQVSPHVSPGNEQLLAHFRKATVLR
jgi:hypothetical protein